MTDLIINADGTYTIPTVEDMTLKQLNQWIARIGVDLDGYGTVQTNTLRKLSYVISGDYLPKGYVNPLGEIVEAYYNKIRVEYETSALAP